VLSFLEEAVGPLGIVWAQQAELSLVVEPGKATSQLLRVLLSPPLVADVHVRLWLGFASRTVVLRFFKPLRSFLLLLDVLA